MDTRSMGGVLLAFAGLVLLIAGFRGTLGKVWQDVTGAGVASPKGGTIVPLGPVDTGKPSAVSASGALYGLPTGYAGTGNLPPNGVPGSVVMG